MGERVSSRFNKSLGNTYINLQSVAYMEEVFTQLVAFMVFFATLKFIKLLRFNKRMGLLAATLKQCAKDLGGFFVMMGLVSCYKTIFARCS
jgi:polycystin 1L2